MAPKFVSLRISEIAKWAFLFQAIGLMFLLLITYTIALAFPDSVKHHLDMSPMNFPEMVFSLGGFTSVTIYPFAVIGSWLIIKILRMFMSLNQT